MQNRTLLWALFLIISFTSAEAICTEAGPWGDQGDGTYRNPILNADYPDVDIEHVGGKYYMITSTNHYAPGMTLLDSKDLVNWRIIGHVWEKLTWAPKYNWDKMGGYGHGVWAGDLACHDGKWYCYFIDFSSGLYVSTAEKITGPWSQPTCMMKKKAWTDPAVFWDGIPDLQFRPRPIRQKSESQPDAALQNELGRPPPARRWKAHLQRPRRRGRQDIQDQRIVLYLHG